LTKRFISLTFSAPCTWEYLCMRQGIKVFFFFFFLTSSIDWRWAAAWARDTPATFDLERNYNFWSKIEHSSAKSIFLLENRTFCSEMIIFLLSKIEHSKISFWDYIRTVSLSVNFENALMVSVCNCELDFELKHLQFPVKIFFQAKTWELSQN
jgi:hypothetical protein